MYYLKCRFGTEGGLLSKNVSLTKFPEWRVYVGWMMLWAALAPPSGDICENV